ncbi:putative late blight resistance protein -like r1a-6 [Nicotiana attenuata]|uniref:Late blight resistance protein -like r1a-6 n=1 Tax=Nicotiana attenuata TaxID=49451 RepID=A0A1J6IFH2_NICAT|nr:putative late blight resistance protein -like r1a-6 [Nicotiana attenuata]
MDEIDKLTYMPAFFQLCYFILDGFDAETSCMSYEVHELVQSLLFHQSGDDMQVKLKDHVIPRLLENVLSYVSSNLYSKSSATMTDDQLVEFLDALLVNLHYIPKCCAELIFPLMSQYEVLQNVCGNFQLMAEKVGQFCLYLLVNSFGERYDSDETYDSDDSDLTLDVARVNSMLAHLLVEIIPAELELIETSPDILREYLFHLQAMMVIFLTASTSARNIHVMIEFLLIILTDVPKGVIHQDKLSILLARVGALTRKVSVLVRDLEENSRNEENMNEIHCACLDFLENIELLKEDLKHVFLKAPVDSSQLCFPLSDGPLFMTLLLRNLNDLLTSNACSVSLIKEEIGLVKEDLEFIRSFFGNVEQELNRDLWTRVLDVAYEVEHAIKSILVRDHGLLHMIFLLPNIIEKIKLIKKKKKVPEMISKNRGLIVVNSPNKPVKTSELSRAGQIIVGFEEETEWIIKKLTGGLAEVDVISIVGMPGLGKTTLAYRVYNDKSVVDHFDVRAWCLVGQERNVKKLLQKIFNQVIGLKERFSEDGIDDDIAEKLQTELFRKRYLIVLDDLWDTIQWDKLIMAFPKVKRGSRIILTSQKKEVALEGKCCSDPLYLRLLRLEESWELLEKRVFGEESCPDELLEIGERIALRCEGLPLVLDLIGRVIARKEKDEILWFEILNNLNSFIFKDEEEVMKVIELSYDHLADHLKPCLLYLASYSKDEDLIISELKALWSAEGLVEQTEMKSVEEVVEVVVDDNLFYNCHLRHLRLLKSLDLRGMSLTDILLNEISMLVHLRCLMIETEVVALPPSFSYLWNLETLLVTNPGSSMVLSPSIWSIAKLGNVIMKSCSISDLCIDEPTVLEGDSKLENLRLLWGLVYSYSKHTGSFFKRFPNLRNLTFTINEDPKDCSAEQICYPRLDVLNELEEVSVYFDCPWPNKHTDFHFPSSLKILRLTRV